MRLPVCVVVAVCTCAVSHAHAQRVGGQRFAPASSEDGVLSTEGADSRMPLRPHVGLWLHYAYDPVVVVVDGEEAGAPVEHLLAADLVASMNVWAGLEFGVGLPVTLWSEENLDPGQAAGAPVAPGTAFGDITVRVGYRLRLADHSALALHVPVLLPTTGSDDPLGLGLGVRPTVAFMQRVGSVELLFNLSYLVRGRAETLDYSGGDELGARFGARFSLDDAWRSAVLLDLGLASAVRDFFAAASTPAEGRVGFEHWLTKDLSLTVFAGTGLSTGVGAADFRAGVGLGYGVNPPYRPRPDPSSGDADGDGILDQRDQCPDDPEDPDGYEDDDGCPDDDNDGDGILDVDDGCPNAPETVNGISDEDGCPDLVRLEDTLIATFEPVHFRTNSEEILPQSHPMLDEVVAILETNPDLRIRIEGHTDDVGDDQVNLDLSQRRADSVRRYLVDHGVPSGQLDAVGHGETRPLAGNRTRAGRAQNRRVEFHIVREE
jgi:outer membrane protein OmpA-like peptidoglycan-associated protein